jgi:hypothetical protein
METNQPAQPGSLEDLFGAPISIYTRKQALEDGFQVEAPIATVREAGFRFPVYITRAAWDAYVEVPAGVDGQDLEGRLWDVLYMLSNAIRRGRGGDRLEYQLYVRNDNRRARLVTLKSQVGPVDHDDPAPAITIMLPDES